MKLQKTFLAITSLFLLISHAAHTGNNRPRAAAYTHRPPITLPTAKNIAIITPDALEVSLLGCYASRQACQPNFVLQRTGCPTSGPITYDSSYECYTCVMDPTLANNATCAAGWNLSWTTAGYACSSTCRDTCRATYSRNNNIDQLSDCLSSCPAAPSLIDGHGCAEGFTQYNQEQSSYSCYFSNLETPSRTDPVCASCNYQGSYAQGTTAEYNCVRHRNPAPETTPTPPRPECSSESDCDDHDPCTKDKCSTENLDGTTTPHCTHNYDPLLCPSTETPPSTTKPIKTTGAGGAPSKSSVGSGGTGGK